MGRLMQQTPVHDSHNPDLLRLIPTKSKKIIEIGCSSGALAREFKKQSPTVHWVGMDIDPDYVELAKRYCDQTLVGNIELKDEQFYREYADCDCWIFGDTLEHLKDPWAVLGHIRKVIPAHGVVTACIPNAQHWSLIVRLAVGDFRYEDDGLLDKTHLRWFTRQTMIELFDSQGFTIAEGGPRIFDEPNRERFLPLIAEIAKSCGANPEVTVNDALPLQYVVRAIPI
jgi:2-polyprenyl-3-methyl-5-hydroxy-6-metoxy-1,4-benzoquinol methylase